MAGPMLGKKIGALHLRVLPDTTQFWKRLEARLKPIEARTHFTVNVDRARVDRERIRASIAAQLGELKNVEARVAAKVTIDGARVNRTLVRADLQRQLAKVSGLRVEVAAVINAAEITVVEATQKMQKVADRTKIQVATVLDEKYLARMRADFDRLTSGLEKTITPSFNDTVVRERINELGRQFEALHGKLANDIMSPEEAAKLRHRLNQINDELNHLARDRETSIQANPFLAWASARLAWLTRTRIVDIVPRVSNAAFTKAATMLAALSGARLSFDYLEDFSRWVGEIDRKLPALTFGITGATTAFSALMAGLSGIVAIGDGFAAMLPSLLLLPGLFAGAAMSGVALFVALKDSKTELAELGPSYTNLGAIIKKAFWDDARPAIVKFSNSIMPQLERSFERTSRAIGRFTAGLAGSLEQAFGGGRLEAMFERLAQSWDIMATGTDAFAGAITNLGLVASRYMPRLAQWFVDLSITFDNWLSAVSTDGRLDDWINESIDAFYALWDVLAATTGIFQGIWKAAEAAGSGGLRGFADMLLAWEEAVNGAKWQATLTAMFRGAETAMKGFSDGLQRVGDMLHGLRDPIEYVMGKAGKALGDFLGDIADALNTPAVSAGLVSLIDGLAAGLAALQPAMGPISDLFATLIGFIGRLAEVLGPVLSTVLAAAAPLFERILQAVEPLLPVLGDALVQAVEAVAGGLETLLDNVDLVPFVENLADAFVGVVDAIVPILPALAPLIQNLADGLAPIVKRLPELVAPLADHLVGLLEVFAPHVPEVLDLVDALLDLVIPLMQLANVALPGFTIALDFALTNLTNLMILGGAVLRTLAGLADGFGKLAKLDFSGAGESFRQAIGQIPDALPSIFDNMTGLIERSTPKVTKSMEAAGKLLGVSLPDGMVAGINASSEKVTSTALGLTSKWHENINLDSTVAGVNAVNTFTSGVASGVPAVSGTALAVAASLTSQLNATAATSGLAGANASGGFAAGITARNPEAVRAALTMALASVAAMKDQGTGANAAGGSYASNLALGILHASVAATIASINMRIAVVRSLDGLSTAGYGIGGQLGAGIANGILASIGRVAAAAAALAANALRAAKAELDIRSPSRRGRREVGMQFGLGVGLGIDDSRQAVERSTRSLTDAMHVAAPSLGGAAATAAAAAVYVQNPFTGEYLLAKVDERADGRIDEALSPVSPGSVMDELGVL